MDAAYSYFLITAEEKNFTKAANRAHITQQSLSEHIKRLEENFRVKLFHRRPHVSLTEAGKIMYKRVLQLRHIEELMRRELQQNHNGHSGTLVVGMHTTRAKLILPEILPQFCTSYPGVSLSVLHAESDALLEQLFSGTIDLFLGTDCPNSPDTIQIPVKEARLYLVISNELFNQYMHAHFTQDTPSINLSHYTDLPLIMSPPNSRLYQTVSHFLADTGIRLTSRLTVSDTDTQLLLVGKNLGACFCNDLLLPKISQLNKTVFAGNPLHYYPVTGLTHHDSLRIVYSRYKYMPLYMQSFIQCIKDYFQQIPSHHIRLHEQFPFHNKKPHV